MAYVPAGSVPPSGDRPRPGGLLCHCLLARCRGGRARRGSPLGAAGGSTRQPIAGPSPPAGSVPPRAYRLRRSGNDASVLASWRLTSATVMLAVGCARGVDSVPVSAVSTVPPSDLAARPAVASARLQRLLPALVGAALALPLATYASVGAFARYVADDYCWAGVLRTQGFLTAQALWYIGYSPRYAFTFIVNVVELAGPAIVPALPATAIVVWLATLSWTFRQLRLPTLGAVLGAEVATLATLQTAPDLGQSLYWQTGMLTYVLPLVLASFLLGWIARAVHTNRLVIWQVALSGLVTLFAGGLSETYLIPQNVLLTLSIGACILWGPRPSRHVALAHLLGALGGGVLALGIIVVAPATTYRLGGGTPADLWLAGSAAIATAAYQVLRLVRYFPLTVLVCLVAPGLILRTLAARGLTTVPLGISGRWFALVTALVAVTLPFCYFPSFYAQNGNPPARSLIVPGALLTSYLLFVGYSAHRRLSAWRPAPAVAAAAMLLVVFVPLGIAASSVPQVAQAAQYATLWDAEDRLIRTTRDAGQADVRVPSLPPNLGEPYVTGDPANWFNVCVARYYGVRTIAAQGGG